MPDTPQITIRELITLGLPAETRVLGGHAHLNRAITWFVTASADASTARFSAGDFVFLLPPYPHELAQRVAQIAQIGVAGIALIGEVMPGMMRAQDTNALALIALPHSADIRRIERIALALLLERTAGLEQRADQLYQRLGVLIAENAGLEAMANLIAETTGKCALIQDKRLETLAAAFLPELEAQRAAIETWTTANLPDEWRDRKSVAQHHDVVHQNLPFENLARLIAPIVVKGVARGFVSLIARGGIRAIRSRGGGTQCGGVRARNGESESRERSGETRARHIRGRVARRHAHAARSRELGETQSLRSRRSTRGNRRGLGQENTSVTSATRNARARGDASARARRARANARK
jgi:hypothetical protein